MDINADKTEIPARLKLQPRTRVSLTSKSGTPENLLRLPAAFDNGIMAKMNQKDKSISVELSEAAAFATLATRAAQILGLLFEPATA